MDSWLCVAQHHRNHTSPPAIRSFRERRVYHTTGVSSIQEELCKGNLQDDDCMCKCDMQRAALFILCAYSLKLRFVYGKQYGIHVARWQEASSSSLSNQTYSIQSVHHNNRYRCVSQVTRNVTDGTWCKLLQHTVGAHLDVELGHNKTICWARVLSSSRRPCGDVDCWHIRSMSAITHDTSLSKSLP